VRFIAFAYFARTYGAPQVQSDPSKFPPRSSQMLEILIECDKKIVSATDRTDIITFPPLPRDAPKRRPQRAFKRSFP
jgi:hypothetical protein